MINVYFTAAVTGHRHDAFRIQYRHIVAAIKKRRCRLISGEQIVKKILLEKDVKRSARAIFARERARIDQSDTVIAEVTHPSTGVGGEVVYALTQNKPVFALVYRNNEEKLSVMIEGNPSEHLFIQHYEEDNIDLIIKKCIDHVGLLLRRKGKLIVIDGADGSGKTTQAELLIAYFKKKHIPVRYFDFPRYYSSFHGKIVSQFLRGEFGTLESVSPYLVSLAYGLDRTSVKEEMDLFLQKGGYIVANRYATSSMAHQSAKIGDVEKREAFLRWVYELEYKVHKIPKEDVVIYLFVPWEKGISLTRKKGARYYLKGRPSDIAEADITHRKKSEKMYQHLASSYTHWITIPCMEGARLKSPHLIHKEVVGHLERRFHI